MRYYLDTEFNGFKGALMTLALVRQDGKGIYAILPSPHPQDMDYWVRLNVLPVMYLPPLGVMSINTVPELLPELIESFLKEDPDPIVISDWPDDHKYFSEAVITGPGKMINIPTLTMKVVRVDAYPTKLQGALQHNAYWDALALLVKCEKILPISLTSR